MNFFVFALESGEPLGTIEGEGLGPFGRNVAESGAAGLQQVTNAVSSIIGVMTLAAGIWFIFQFLIGGFNWITSGGDKGKLEQARDRLTNAFIGLIVVIAGWSILALAGKFFNVDLLISNPENIMNNLGL